MAGIELESRQLPKHLFNLLCSGYLKKYMRGLFIYCIFWKYYSPEQGSRCVKACFPPQAIYISWLPVLTASSYLSLLYPSPPPPPFSTVPPSLISRSDFLSLCHHPRHSLDSLPLYFVSFARLPPSSIALFSLSTPPSPRYPPI